MFNKILAAVTANPIESYAAFFTTFLVGYLFIGIFLRGREHIVVIVPLAMIFSSAVVLEWNRLKITQKERTHRYLFKTTCVDKGGNIYKSTGSPADILCRKEGEGDLTYTSQWQPPSYIKDPNWQSNSS